MIHFLAKSFNCIFKKVFSSLCTYNIHTSCFVKSFLWDFCWIGLFESFYTSSWVKSCHNFSKTSHNKFKVVKTRWENNTWKLFLKLVETNNISRKEEWLWNFTMWPNNLRGSFRILIRFYEKLVIFDPVLDTT